LGGKGRGLKSLGSQSGERGGKGGGGAGAFSQGKVLKGGLRPNVSWQEEKNWKPTAYIRGLVFYPWKRVRAMFCKKRCNKSTALSEKTSPRKERKNWRHILNS